MSKPHRNAGLDQLGPVWRGRLRGFRLNLGRGALRSPSISALVARGRKSREKPSLAKVNLPPVGE